MPTQNGKTIYYGGSGDSSGIDITFYKTKRELSIGGYYDHCVGIQNETVSLGDFLRLQGITLADCQKALKAL